jgi:hypothetical protein
LSWGAGVLETSFLKGVSGFSLLVSRGICMWGWSSGGKLFQRSFKVQPVLFQRNLSWEAGALETSLPKEFQGLACSFPKKFAWGLELWKQAFPKELQGLTCSFPKAFVLGGWSSRNKLSQRSFKV